MGISYVYTMDQYKYDNKGYHPKCNSATTTCAARVNPHTDTA
jgi:hypothetical protein